MLERGADSAIFNIDALGNPLMIATSLKFRNSGDEGGKKWPVHGVVTAASDEKRMALYEAREAYSHIKTFFYPVPKEKKEEGSWAESKEMISG